MNALISLVEISAAVSLHTDVQNPFTSTTRFHAIPASPYFVVSDELLELDYAMPSAAFMERFRGKVEDSSSHQTLCSNWLNMSLNQAQIIDTISQMTQMGISAFALFTLLRAPEKQQVIFLEESFSLLPCRDVKDIPCFVTVKCEDGILYVDVDDAVGSKCYHRGTTVFSRTL